MIRFVLTSAGVALLLAGCADVPTAPEPAPAPTFLKAAASPVDVAGEWQWVREERLTFPPIAATMIFDVVPEGQRTHATCRMEGTLTLVQDGASIAGSEATTSSVCETRGGQTFSLSSPASITGEFVGPVALHLTREGMVPCLIRAVARNITDGVASTLQGSGRCIIPGHPQSPVPGFDPPPLGTEVITSWTAVR